MFDYKINIIGVIERKGLISQLCTRLNLAEKSVIYDNNKLGPLSSVIKSLAVNENNVSHTVLLQDDAWPCNNFNDICEQIIATHSNSVVGLFPFDFMDEEVKPINGSTSPYYDVGILSGVGLIFPNKYTNAFIEFAKKSPYPREDDRTILMFCRTNNIEVLQTVPAVVQHIGDKSILSETEVVRRSNYFDIDMDVNWNSLKVNHLRYHSSLERKVAEKIEWSKQYIKNLTKERSQNNNR